MRRNWLGILALGAVCTVLALAPSPARAAGNCGDGVLASNEECDGGPGGLFIDGDPAKGACATGSRCYFQFTCCKFNCQYVGTPGVPCQDGNSCSDPDICNQVGQCNGTANVANGTACDDGLFCTGTESCQNGACTASTGNPCPGTACNLCQEGTDSCFNPNATPCSDGNGCVTGGTCDGAGVCNGGSFTSGACDDGVFCNGDDTCGGGACSVHTGDPCAGPDGDGNCAESCDEELTLCTAADTNGSACDDGLFCDGAADACSAGSCVGTGAVACDDHNSCTTDVCDEGTDACSVGGVSGDGLPCDDADPCSIADVCASGVCVGSAPLMIDLCPWTVVMREQPKTDLIKTNFQVSIDGDVCGGTLKLSGSTAVSSDLVSAETTGTGQIRLAVDASVGDDIVSGGAGAKAYPGSDDLPMLASLGSTLAPGTLTAKADASGSYDLTGTNALAVACTSARAAYAPTTASLDALGQTTSLPFVKIAPGATQTILATNVGGLNVVDIDGSVKAGKDAVIELDGGGNANTVMVLRVGGKFSMLLRSALSLTGGLSPQHTLVYVKGKKCLLADLSIGGGTMFCSPASLKTGRTVAWVGTLYGDGKLLKIGEKTSLHYTPFQGF